MAGGGHLSLSRDVGKVGEASVEFQGSPGSSSMIGIETASHALLSLCMAQSFDTLIK